MHKHLLASLQAHGALLGWTAVGLGALNLIIGAAWAYCEATYTCPMGSGAMFLGIGGGALLVGSHLLGLPARLRAWFADSPSTPDARVFTTTAVVPADDWRRVVSDAELPMTLAYLEGVSAACNLEHRFALAYRDGHPVAAGYFQIIDVDPSAIGRDAAAWPGPARWLLERLGAEGKGSVRVLVCGNVFHTKSGGFITAANLDPNVAADLLLDMISAVDQPKPAALTLLKDVPLTAAMSERVAARGFHAVESTQPTMTVPLSPAWTCEGDYAGAMQSKYRKRVRAARNKGAALQRRVLSAEHMRQHRAELDRLLHAVVQRVEFKLAACNVDTLIALQESLGSRMQVTAYTINDANEGERWVGFAAAVIAPQSLEALVVGLDYDVNLSLAVYENILYDYVCLGIATRSRSVHLGRTALEIKSTLGAEPEHVPILVRHRSAVINMLLGQVLRTVKPPAWIQRHPFKAAEDNA